MFSVRKVTLKEAILCLQEKDWLQPHWACAGVQRNSIEEPVSVRSKCATHQRAVSGYFVSLKYFGETSQKSGTRP
jgi:hypothetical protein